ncbi:MAG: response regulator transcription factor [Pelolinea sp.]|nr:response regulator transcription factor [Pelolinea sp.]
MQNIRIILADDHAVVRAGIRKTIEQIPHLEVVAEVGTGPLVFNSLKKQQVDLLLIDVTMPEFDPIQAIKEIKILYPDLKILVISAYDDEFYVKGLLNVGVNGYHMKDQSLNDLKMAVNRVLEGETWISNTLINKLSGNFSNKKYLPELSKRQRDLLLSLQQGLDNKTIAKNHFLSIKTIENNLSTLYRKLNVQSRLEAVYYIARHPEIIRTPDKFSNSANISKSAEPGSGYNILVVDDNARYRSQLIRMLGKLDSRATIFNANDIKHALDLIRDIKFKLVFIDVILNEESGIYCAEQIRTIQPDARTILISAYPDQEFRKEGIKVGVVAFLDKKDLGSSTLRQIVEDIKE